MVISHAVLIGLKKSLHLCIKIAKIIIPVYFIIELLDYINVLPYIANLFEPFMHLFGLPGEAAIAFILGNGINVYGALAAMGSLTLTVREVTILGLMVCISHALILETSILKGVKTPIWYQLVLRFGVSIIVGITLNLIWV